jgi:hypothetical protein
MFVFPPFSPSPELNPACGSVPFFIRQFSASQDGSSCLSAENPGYPKLSAQRIRAWRQSTNRRAPVPVRNLKLFDQNIYAARQEYHPMPD